jgi:hypothetical protein
VHKEGERKKIRYCGQRKNGGQSERKDGQSKREDGQSESEQSQRKEEYAKDTHTHTHIYIHTAYTHKYIPRHIRVHTYIHTYRIEDRSESYKSVYRCQELMFGNTAVKEVTLTLRSSAYPYAIIHWAYIYTEVYPWKI